MILFQQKRNKKIAMISEEKMKADLTKVEYLEEIGYIRKHWSGIELTKPTWRCHELEFNYDKRVQYVENIIKIL